MEMTRALTREALLAKISRIDASVTRLQAKIDETYAYFGDEDYDPRNYVLDRLHRRGLDLRQRLAALDTAELPVAAPVMVQQVAQLQQANASRPTGAACEACGRPLTDPFSIKTGIGPVCRAAGHEGRRQLHFDDLLAGADFESEIVDGVICLIDLDQGGPTVTNAAVAVVADLVYQKFDVDNLPVIYRDSAGRWDQILIKERQFVGFAPLGVRHRCEALALLAERQARPVTVVSVQDLMSGALTGHGR